MRTPQRAVFSVLAVLGLMACGCGKPEGTASGSSSAGRAASASPAAAAGTQTAGEQLKASETAAVSAKDAKKVEPLEPPAAATYEFLEALRTGDDRKAVSLLSSLAREKAASLNRHVTPTASDTARFSIGKVQYVGEDGAQVACTWTDLDEEGKPNSDMAVWVLRRESEGWRIAGVASKVFEDRDPVVLNFEDPEDLLRQQQWIRTEMERRMRAELELLQAKDERGETKSQPR